MRNRDMGTIRPHPLGAGRRLPMEPEDRLPGRQIRDLHVYPPYPGRPPGSKGLECRLLDGETRGKILNPIPTGLFQLSGVVDPAEETIPETIDTSPDPRDINEIEPHTDDHDYL